MLIDITYFQKGSRQILNAISRGLPSAGNQEVCAYVESYIKEFQYEYLKRVLGEKLGTRLQAYLLSVDEEIAVPNENMDAICDRLREPFADYIFFKLLKDVGQQTAITGFAKLKGANEIVSPIDKQVRTWNAMVAKHLSFCTWAQESSQIEGIVIDGDLLTPINSLNL